MSKVENVCRVYQAVASRSKLLLKTKNSAERLDGGAHFYTTYETKDGGWMAVGALEPQFYEQLLRGLDLTDIPQFSDNFAEYKKIFADKFKEKTRDEWCEIFKELDACVTPVLSLTEAAAHPHNRANQSFSGEGGGVVIPSPAPRLSVTPGQSMAHLSCPRPGQHTRQVLSGAGLLNEEISLLQSIGAIKCCESDSKL